MDDTACLVVYAPGATYCRVVASKRMKRAIETLARQYDTLFKDSQWVMWCGLAGFVLIVSYGLGRTVGFDWGLSPGGRYGLGYFLFRHPFVDTEYLYVDSLVVVLFGVACASFFSPRTIPRIYSICALLLLSCVMYVVYF